jgi:hypothetical protein
MEYIGESYEYNNYIHMILQCIPYSMNTIIQEGM